MSLAAASYNPFCASSEVFARSLRREVVVSYLVVIIRRKATYGAHLPDAPGCIATSTDLADVRALIRDGLALHLEGVLEDGDELPVARTLRFVKALREGEAVVEQVTISVKMPIPPFSPR